jgi:TolB-like protein
MEVYHKTLYEPPPALTGSRAIAVADQAIRRALARRPDDRFQSAREMSDALEEAASLARDESSAPVARRVARLMVLPFRMLRPDEETEFLAFSVPDAITGALTGLESLVVRSSAVAARFASESPDLRRIAEEADVDVVLTGTLLRAGEKLRASVQLFEVPSGTLLWSHSPRVTMRDVFQLQDQLVERIVDSLSLSLTAREQRRLRGDVPASPAAYESFLRANQLLAPHGLGTASKLHVARDLYRRATEEDPHFAPTWARLGRCHWLLAKSGEDKAENVQEAETCFRQALELNHELPLTHTLYALLEIDQGRALDAMARLLRRALADSNQPELFAGLVQACRFCGLLEASVAAHERAVALDRHAVTSVYQTYWDLGDHDRFLETMRSPGYSDALILGMRGEREKAIRLLEEREPNVGPLMANFLAPLRGVLSDDRELCLRRSQPILDAFPDPEFVFYVCRHLAYFGEKQAISGLARSLERGFVSYRSLVRSDPWLDPLRGNAEFAALTEEARRRYQAAIEAYVEAGGERLLVPAARMR